MILKNKKMNACESVGSTSIDIFSVEDLNKKMPAGVRVEEVTPEASIGDEFIYVLKLPANVEVFTLTRDESD